MSVVLVTGDRDFTNAKLIGKVLFNLAPSILIEGGAKGADTLAGEWADARNIMRITIPANWKLYGRGAGPIRNKEMLSLLMDYHKQGSEVLVVGFHNHIEESAGTSNMLLQAETSGVNYTLVWEDSGDRDKVYHQSEF